MSAPGAALPPFLSLESGSLGGAALEPGGPTADEAAQRQARVELARAELAQHLTDAARALRNAELTVSKLHRIDYDHTPGPDLRRAIEQALTGVHAAKYLAPAPEQSTQAGNGPGW